jgi:hypothetical protein
MSEQTPESKYGKEGTPSPQVTNTDKLRHELSVMKKELIRYGSPQTFINRINDVETAIVKLEHFRDIR